MVYGGEREWKDKMKLIGIFYIWFEFKMFIHNKTATTFLVIFTTPPSSHLDLCPVSRLLFFKYIAFLQRNVKESEN